MHMRNFDSAPPSSSPHSTSEAVQQNENMPLKNYDLVQTVDKDVKSISVDENKVVVGIVAPNEGGSNPGVLGSKKGEKLKLQKLLEELSDSDTRRIERYIKDGKPDKASLHIAGLGLPMTSQEELIKHFTQYLEDGINRISWTGKRLAYAVAILEYTLDSEGNNHITSVENLIQNYLVFCKTFKEYEEDKIPRYGQFSYVMRSIFAGITSKEEIVERIQKHKTFGQKAELTEDELSQLHSSAQEVRKDFLEAKKKKLDLDRAMGEALQEEHEEKGKVWSWKFSAPREYEFPNYRFQTGPKKDQNKSVGRSSWEPLFEAYADTVNKKIEDRISKKEGISGDEKERRIKETRIELLYEKFEFPVGIRTDKNGNSKPIVYILDFVDINRWRGIEIKGPLTPKAAEKIRLFQKYYVEGDFSDLPKDEQIIMMEYVQDALDGVRDYCIKNKHPVFNQFSSLDVLGMYKWDYDLNNFNQYRGAKDMQELSKRERDLLQKGFFKLIEDRISDGKTPDIRPVGYVKTDKLSEDIVSVNEKMSKKEKVKYQVEKVQSTRPYVPNLIIDYVMSVDKSKREEAVVLSVMRTVPLNQEIVPAILLMQKSIDTMKKIDRELNTVTKQNSMEKVYEGKSRIEFDTDIISATEYQEMISSLIIFKNSFVRNAYLYSQKYGIDEQKVIKIISLSINFYEKSFDVKKRKFIITKDLLMKNNELQHFLQDNNLENLINVHIDSLEGDYRFLIRKRMREINAMINFSERKNANEILSLDEINDRINFLIKNPEYLGDETLSALYYLVAEKSLLKEKNKLTSIYSSYSLMLLLGINLVDSGYVVTIPFNELMLCINKLITTYDSLAHVANEVAGNDIKTVEGLEKFIEKIKSQDKTERGLKSNTLFFSQMDNNFIKLIANFIVLQEISSEELDEIILNCTNEYKTLINVAQFNVLNNNQP